MLHKMTGTVAADQYMVLFQQQPEAVKQSFDLPWP